MDATELRTGTPALVLRVVVNSGDPVSGTVAREAQGPPVSFSGWTELMAVITEARLSPAP